MRSKTRSRLKALSALTKVKHIVDNTDLLTSGNTTQFHTIIEAVDNPVLASVEQIATGSKVHNVIVQINAHSIQNAGVAAIRLDWYFMFCPKGNPDGTTITFPLPNATGSSNYKELIIKSGMEMVVSSQPVLLKGVIKIPAKWQKFGKGDKLVFVYRFIDATANQSNLCSHMIYREYR